MHCYVRNNAVEDGPRPLPKEWRDPVTGQQYSNLPALGSAQLLTIGWYPYSDNDTGSPGNYYQRVYSDFTIEATEVTRTVTYEQLPIDEIKILKNTELVGQPRAYTVNDFGLNRNVLEYIKDDAQWVADRQGELLQLEDWQTTAEFDTLQPRIVTLPNSYVGRSYVDQASRLTAENETAISMGLTPPWNQAELNTFAVANQAAADDPSNNTPPHRPNYKIRQGIGNVSEQFRRVIIYRFDRSDPDPAQRRSFAMRMLNRQDDRPLYAFAYKNSTLLSSHLFAPRGNGVWGWDEEESQARTQADEDLKFIFSYSPTEAVEAEYFTDEVHFPAGVQYQNLLVAWDPE